MSTPTFKKPKPYVPIGDNVSRSETESFYALGQVDVLDDVQLRQVEEFIAKPNPTHTVIINTLGDSDEGIWVERSEGLEWYDYNGPSGVYWGTNVFRNISRNKNARVGDWYQDKDDHNFYEILSLQIVDGETSVKEINRAGKKKFPTEGVLAAYEDGSVILYDLTAPAAPMYWKFDPRVLPANQWGTIQDVKYYGSVVYVLTNGECPLWVFDFGRNRTVGISHRTLEDSYYAPSVVDFSSLIKKNPGLVSDRPIGRNNTQLLTIFPKDVKIEAGIIKPAIIIAGESNLSIISSSGRLNVSSLIGRFHSLTRLRQSLSFVLDNVMYEIDDVSMIEDGFSYNSMVTSLDVDPGAYWVFDRSEHIFTIAKKGDNKVTFYDSENHIRAINSDKGTTGWIIPTMVSSLFGDSLNETVTGATEPPRDFITGDSVVVSGSYARSPVAANADLKWMIPDGQSSTSIAIPFNSNFGLFGSEWYIRFYVKNVTSFGAEDTILRRGDMTQESDMTVKAHVDGSIELTIMNASLGPVSIRSEPGIYSKEDPTQVCIAKAGDKVALYVNSRLEGSEQGVAASYSATQQPLLLTPKHSAFTLMQAGVGAVTASMIQAIFDRERRLFFKNTFVTLSGPISDIKRDFLTGLTHVVTAPSIDMFRGVSGVRRVQNMGHPFEKIDTEMGSYSVTDQTGIYVAGPKLSLRQHVQRAFSSEDVLNTRGDILSALDETLISKTGVLDAEANVIKLEAYAENWATYPVNQPIPASGGGDGVSTYSSFHWAEHSRLNREAAESFDAANKAAKAWAFNDEGVPVSVENEGDGSTTFSSKHYSIKAEASQIAAKTSEDAAHASQLAAKGNQDTTESHAVDAGLSRDAAKVSQDAAKVSEDAAYQYKIDAQQSASDAANSAAVVTNGLFFKGSWDASTGIEPPAPTTGYPFYKVSVAGAIGGVDYNPGDSIVWEGNGYFKIDNTDVVASVNGKVGAVVLGKGDIGLINVDNTSDVDKPISTATQTALDTKASAQALADMGRLDWAKDISGGDLDTLVQPGMYFGNSLTNVPSGTLTDSWIVSVDVGTATSNTIIQTAHMIAGSAAGVRARYIRTHIAGSWSFWDRVITESGVATTSTNGTMSAADKTKLDGIEAGASANTVDSVAGKTGAVTLSKSDVGLANVDNTSDISKPVSTAQQASIDLKADKSMVDEQAALSEKTRKRLMLLELGIHIL